MLYIVYNMGTMLTLLAVTITCPAWVLLLLLTVLIMGRVVWCASEDNSVIGDYFTFLLGIILCLLLWVVYFAFFK
jgi:hypothetical protein